jgi:hypothetical protein
MNPVLDLDPGLIVKVYSRKKNPIFSHQTLQIIPPQAGVFRIRIKSGQWIRILIWILNPDPDPGGQKLPHKRRKKLKNLMFCCAGWLKTSSAA